MNIVVTNVSTLVADADAVTLTGAVALQMEVVAGEYDRDVPAVSFVPLLHLPGSGPADVLVVILDDADQAGALGYHSETPDGLAYARVFARDSIAGIAGVDPASLSGPQPSDVVLNAVAQVVSHEVIEAFVDEHANDWADDGTGNTAWALEACDPVESDTYIVTFDGDAVTVSNFVLPAFFDPAGSAPFDFLGNVAAPFSLDAGGYAITETESGIQAVWGDMLAPWRKRQHAIAAADGMSRRNTAALASRTGKRFSHSHRQASPRADVPSVTVTDDGEWKPSEPVPVGPGHYLVQDNVTNPGHGVLRHYGANGELIREQEHDSVIYSAPQEAADAGNPDQTPGQVVYTAEEQQADPVEDDGPAIAAEAEDDVVDEAGAGDAG